MWDKTVFYHIPRTLLVYSINTAFNSCKDKDYYFPGEMHNFWEMVYIKKGKAIITKNDKIYRLNEGETAIHPPMEFHRIMSDGEEFEIIVISFSSNSDILYSLPCGVIGLDKGLSNELYEIFDEIKSAFNIDDFFVCGGKSPVAEQMAVCKFEHFLLSLIAKENVVATFGMLFGFAEVAEDGAEIWGNLAQVMTPIAAYGFLVFNLLCAPCFAAMGAIKREMNNAKWFWFAIGYQCIFAYIVALCIYQFGTLFTGGGFGLWTVVAVALLVGFLYMLFRPYKESKSLKVA